MKNNEKFIIWDSEAWIENFNDWKESYIDVCEANEIDIDPENITEDEVNRYAIETNNDYLNCERMNLDIDIPNGIIAIADVGKWCGRVSGYKEIGNNIADCLYTDMDIAQWYVDPWGVFRGYMADHDGQTFVVYRAWKDNVTEEQKERVLEGIYNGGVSERTLRRYTRNIGVDIVQVYGWKIRGCNS